MLILLEHIVIYTLAAILCILVVRYYLRRIKKKSEIVGSKIATAIEKGIHEPISLHPYIDVNRCIQTGACIAACYEHDIIGIRDGVATLINASKCVGHGACFLACPTEAISLRIGTEKRGVELPNVGPNFETNVPGIYIAGELGGMGLIKNAVAQGKQACENIIRNINKNHSATYDLIIVGAGPAGISASLTAKKGGLKFLTLEQDTLGGTVFTFPRKKIVMTTPMDLPLFGLVKLYETSKAELLDLWHSVLKKNDISIHENSKVESIEPVNGIFKLASSRGEHFTASNVLLAIGRRGTPRKLNIPGEMSEKVAYRLIEPERISGKNIVVVGGGDSAVETALLLSEENRVILSYRNEAFNRIKDKNNIALDKAVKEGKIDVRLGTNPILIEKNSITLSVGKEGESIKMDNDLVYIFAGGELPTQFLQKAGINIEKKFGETVLKH